MAPHMMVRASSAPRAATNASRFWDTKNSASARPESDGGSWRPCPEEDAQERHDGQEGEQRQDPSQRVECDVARQAPAKTEDESEQVAEPPHAPVVPM